MTIRQLGVGDGGAVGSGDSDGFGAGVGTAFIPESNADEGDGRPGAALADSVGGHAVRTAGAPAFTGADVGLMPHPASARTASNTAPTQGRGELRDQPTAVVERRTYLTPPRSPTSPAEPAATAP